MKSVRIIQTGLRLIAFAIFTLGCISAVAQDKTRVVLTPRSNVSTSEVGKGLDKYCPAIMLSDDTTKTHYTLEAWDTGAGPGRKLRIPGHVNTDSGAM
jgi:hypothetical protein